jgi:3-hydroxyacyl-CoA dehydrogenase
LFESDVRQREVAPARISVILGDLLENGLLSDAVELILGRIRTPAEISEALDGAVHVQECVSEALDVKKSVFKIADQLTSASTVIASSSSSLTCSMIAADIRGRQRCLLAHPANPPYLLPVVEVAPASFTSDHAVARTFSLMADAGMTPIHVHAEIEGLAYNRLQGALLREAYCLVRDGVVTADDIDRLVRDGLGRRWAVIGPFATAELNTRGGLVAHAARLGEAYGRMGTERGQNDPWTKDLVEKAAEQIHRQLPPERWDDNVRARDRALMVIGEALGRASLPGTDDFN